MGIFENIKNKKRMLDRALSGKDPNEEPEIATKPSTAAPSVATKPSAISKSDLDNYYKKLKDARGK